MNFNSLFAPRIREERERLGLTQAEAGERCGVSREIWGKYERGKATPGGEVLFSFAQIGGDIQYIFTGQRSVGVLPPRESALLDNYRNSDEEGKRTIESVAVWRRNRRRQKV